MSVFLYIAEPQISQAPPDEVVTAVGLDVAIMCVAVGFPVPGISWVFGGTTLTPAGDIGITDTPIGTEISSTLTLFGITADRAGTYSCGADNSEGVATTDTEVVITGKS